MRLHWTPIFLYQCRNGGRREVCTIYRRFKCGPYFGEVTQCSDGQWSWECGRVTYLADGYEDPLLRGCEYVERANGLATTRRRAQCAARKAITKMRGTCKRF